MSLTPSNVPWDGNRLKATEYIIKYDSSGNGYLDKQEADYTNVNYNFASLPAAGTTTTSGTTTTGTTTTDTTTGQITTQEQTAQAFGEGIIPHYWKDTEDISGVGSSTTDQTKLIHDMQAYEDKPTKLIHDMQAYEDESKTPIKDFLKEGWGLIQKGIESSKRKFQIPLGITGAIFAALTKRPTIAGFSADNSFRGVAGLYSKEISLMNKYGSLGPTIHNPHGDTRKDDAGFNLVSWAGDYNVIGSNSRRHNMLKEADIKYEKNSKEWKAERNKIRTVWKAEKDTNTQISDLDASGSIPTENGKTKTITPKTKSVVARSAPSPHREGREEYGGGSVTPAQAGMVGRYDGGLT
tara:strand:+ start:45 stop:1100 length:1056 start_codon:yes stop_codon:yes gene_type:complete